MSAKLTTELRRSLTGILPPVTTPFDSSGTLVAEGFTRQIDWIMDSGSSGIVIGGSTGEGHTLSVEEFGRSMAAAEQALRGRGSLVAGLIVNSTQEAVERVRMLEGMKVDALQVTPVHYLFKPEAEATVEHFRTICDATPIPVLIYNVIPWNYLSVDLMLRIMDEVPGVIGMKQSNGDLKSVSDLLARLKPENMVVTGIDALLYSAFTLGVDGAITALTAAVPGATVRLWDAVAAGDHATAKDLHFKLGRLYNAFDHGNLPACTKYAQHRQGLEMFHPRPPMEPVSERQRKAIDQALAELI